MPYLLMGSVPWYTSTEIYLFSELISFLDYCNAASLDISLVSFSTFPRQTLSSV